MKSYFDGDRGLQCTCVNLSTLEKAHKKDPDSGIDKYASSLLHKLLAKTNAQAMGQEEFTERNARSSASVENAARWFPRCTSTFKVGIGRRP